MENKSLEVVNNEIAITAGEVLEYVRNKLAPTVAEERSKIETALEIAKTITEINSAEEYTDAVNASKGLKRIVKDGKAVLEETKKKANAVWKAFTSSQNDMEEGTPTEIKRLDKLASDYEQEQERIRQQKQREAEAKAKKEAEERAIAEAAELEALGDTEGAEEVISEPVVAPSVEIAKSTPEVKGSHYRDNWKAKSINPTKLPREYMMPDLVKINKEITKSKGDTSIPGVEVFNDRTRVDR
jgi:hypothetical protein